VWFADASKVGEDVVEWRVAFQREAFQALDFEILGLGVGVCPGSLVMVQLLRIYVGRVSQFDAAWCAEVALRWAFWVGIVARWTGQSGKFPDAASLMCPLSLMVGENAAQG
jgi:hypothetical protein